MARRLGSKAHTVLKYLNCRHVWACEWCDLGGHETLLHKANLNRPTRIVKLNFERLMKNFEELKRKEHPSQSQQEFPSMLTRRRI